MSSAYHAAIMQSLQDACDEQRGYALEPLRERGIS